MHVSITRNSFERETFEGSRDSAVVSTSKNARAREAKTFVTQTQNYTLEIKR